MPRPTLAQGYLAFTMLTAVALGAPHGATADDQRIGAAAAVVPATSGHSASGMSIQIIDGSSVFHQQRVVTEAEGRAQLIFLDGSAVTVGPQSEVTLDEFVYDPDKRLAGATLNATRGVLRYVGGKISKTVDVKINTPTATIGVRGGIVVVDIEQGGRTNAYFLYGERMSLTSNGVTEVAQRPGSIISHTPGRPPAPARLASPGEMRQAVNGLQAPGRQQPNQPQGARPGQAPQQGQNQQGQNQQGQNQQGQNQQGGNQPGQAGQGQPGQQQAANRPGQPGANQPGQNQQGGPQPGQNQPQGQPQNPQQRPQPANAQMRGPGAPLAGNPGQPGIANLDRGAQVARSENNLPRALGGNNSRMGPGNIAPPSVGNFGRVGPPNGAQGPRPNGPLPPGPGGIGPRPVPIDGIARIVQQGAVPMMPPPGSPPPPPPQ